MINFNVIVDLILLTIVCENVDHVTKLLSLSLRLVSIIQKQFGLKASAVDAYCCAFHRQSNNNCLQKKNIFIKKQSTIVCKQTFLQTNIALTIKQHFLQTNKQQLLASKNIFTNKQTTIDSQQQNIFTNKKTMIVSQQKTFLQTNKLSSRNSRTRIFKIPIKCFLEPRGIISNVQKKPTHTLCKFAN